ncbi:class I SAM-dependent methyltransferase [Aquimarina sp. ERC-38]|uniref:class I SAM-dependent methyltransferase n=1 Tax=Aquimarina sp. ERC-38 TaxID=2949996 RepID=UPI00224711AD|nr:class I SAM-dependent methyltransferase [Aquimarina sp. ERC-38]UZO80822.1 class I SAM-dependent methyltransferase [Aquimarina sp. ERC-38]
MRLLTPDDFIDVYVKLKQRGFGFIRSKFTTDSLERTKSAFNDTDIQTSNFWSIPKIKERWNLKITGNSGFRYEDFVMQEFFEEKHNLKMLSLGSGSCDHELYFAHYKNFAKITCVDINDLLFEQAKQIALDRQLENMEFVLKSIYNMDFKAETYDIIYFHASLHHFEKLEDLLGNQLKNVLKKEGKLIINEFVGPDRLQFPKYQIQAINKSLSKIPAKYRIRFKTSLIKKKVTAPGWLRMYIADPSECVASSQILPIIYKHYNKIYEAPYGGNLLMLVFKDIAHHFIKTDKEKEAVLQEIFKEEDQYLEVYPSDFIFGVYEKKNLH